MKHIKTAIEEYHLNDQDRHQGEYKEYYSNGELYVHCFFVDGKYHGEYKSYYENGQLFVHCFFVANKRHREYKSYGENGQLRIHCFFVDGVDVTDEVKPLLSDISNITQEEKVIFKLQLGLDI